MDSISCSLYISNLIHSSLPRTMIAYVPAPITSKYLPMQTQEILDPNTIYRWNSNLLYLNLLLHFGLPNLEGKTQTLQNRLVCEVPWILQSPQSSYWHLLPQADWTLPNQPWRNNFLSISIKDSMILFCGHSCYSSHVTFQFRITHWAPQCGPYTKGTIHRHLHSVSKHYPELPVTCPISYPTLILDFNLVYCSKSAHPNEEIIISISSAV